MERARPGTRSHGDRDGWLGRVGGCRGRGSSGGRDRAGLHPRSWRARALAEAVAAALIGLAAGPFPAAGQATTDAPGLPAAPAAAVRPVSEVYFGTSVTDPYRYLEDLADPVTQEWLKGQDDYTRMVLAQVPRRAQLLARIRELDQAATARVSGVQRLAGERYYYLQRQPDEDAPKLYLRIGAGGQPTLLVDPARYAQGADDFCSLDYYVPSFDGRYVAFGVSCQAAPGTVLHILDTATGQEAAETIDRAQFGAPGWLLDNRSFLYTRLREVAPDAAPGEMYLDSRVYLHVVGTNPDGDPPVFGRGLSAEVTADPADLPVVTTFPDGMTALAALYHGAASELTLYCAPVGALGTAQCRWQKVCDVADGVTGYCVRGDYLYLLTYLDAPRFRAIRTSLSRPDLAAAEQVVPLSERVVQKLAASADGVYVQLLDGGVGRLVRVPASGGNPEPVPLPFDGAIDIGLSGHDPRVSGLLLEMTSWTRAPRVYAYSPKTGRFTDTGLQPAGPFDDPPDLESREVRVPSHDGTLVPLSIVHRRGLKLDGSHPAWLEAYGAHGYSLEPFFNPKMLAWLERGGIYAVAHVRGGGEYGEAWHFAGMGANKPNSWLDLIACAEYLVARRYTSPARLAGQGISAGGIAIGRAITARPELFAAAIVTVGSANPLRTVGLAGDPASLAEFGMADTEEGFQALLAMDTYHQVQDGKPYPGVLLTTGVADPRVIAWEPAKLAARLQAATSSGRPVLLRVEFSDGEGLGSAEAQRQEELADEMSFLLWQLGAQGFQPAGTDGR